MAGLPRDIIKWLQSLNLSAPVRNIKWDFSNGYLLAEIFSWYYPSALSIQSFNRGESIESKLKNWDLLRVFLKRQNMTISEENIEATIHCKEGGAHLLIKEVYESLTSRRIAMPNLDNVDFTDEAYQMSIPINARSNAVKQLKNNIRISEMIAHPSLTLNQQKAQHLLLKYKAMRQKQKEEEPERYGVKPTLGQMCARKAPRQPTFFGQTETSLLPDGDNKEENDEHDPNPSSTAPKVTEIPVRQTPKTGNYQPLVIG